MKEAAETVIKRLENGPIEVRARNIFGFGPPPVVQALGPDDFPWDEPNQILELYHGQMQRWSRPRQRMRGTGVLIHPLIESSLGVTPQRRNRLRDDPAVRYLSRENSAFLLATADVGDEFRKPSRCETPVVFVNGDWDLNTPIENMHEIAPYFPNSHSLTVQQEAGGTRHDYGHHVPGTSQSSPAADDLSAGRLNDWPSRRDHLQTPPRSAKVLSSQTGHDGELARKCRKAINLV